MTVAQQLMRVTVVLAVAVGVASSIGAAPMPASSSVAVPATGTAARQGICLLGFIDCAAAPATSVPSSSAVPGDPATSMPTPVPVAVPVPSGVSGGDPAGIPTPVPAIPGVPAVPTVAPTGAAAPSSPSPGAPAKSTGPLAEVLAPADPNAMPLTDKPATMGADTLSISGLQSIGVVTVTLPNGDTARHIRLEADHISIDGFSLDTRDTDGHGVLTTASNMTADGTVVVYLDSIAGLLASGASALFDVLHTLPTAADLAGLTALKLDLYGLSGNTLTLTGSHEALS
ncbi:hypothetical protein [Subtercola endophyticus]|uniref:hypothetical protein n=1 Tax=Subtercola endophyticus TaxID=2895559 RepID=UPI001E3384BF|nr:hypothetical protein [Subtercola endophyticus]UFS59683.1 hypothetical protein LQ955_02465 [Subtercola endophyticus]